MNDDDVAEVIREERLALVRHLSTLDAEAWRRPSLCRGWTTHDVLAHLVTPFEVSMPRMALSMLRRGPAGAMDVWARHLARRPVAELLDVLEANAGSTWRPPGMPLAAPLTDVLVHGLDIRWAVAPERTVDHVEPEHVRPVLEFLVTPRAAGVFHPPGRLDGLRLAPDDLDLSLGPGPTVVDGPALAVVAAVLRP